MKKILLMKFMLLMLISVAWAQERTVSGKVTEEDGAPLPGVNVIVRGTSIGAITDADGNYSLSISASVAEPVILAFTFIGMKTQEVALNNQSQINATMVADASQLAEVVVTGLGFERATKSLGYVVTKVGSDDITRGRSTNVMSGLQGKVAGVQISTASGAPGASTKVVIRGYTSLAGGNNPLYVIDGVPINNSAGNFGGTFDRTQDFGNRANDINPDDIAEITILKGASAASLYGSRAASGVIMITTKRGKAGSGVSVDFTTSATLSTPLRLPQRQTVFGQGWNGHYASEENGSWGPKLDGKDRLWGNVVDNSQQIKPFTAQEDNLKDFFDVGKSFINTLAISGGTDKATYYLSYSNVSEDGIVPSDRDSYKRNTFSFRGSTIGKKLFTSYSVNYINKRSQFITAGQGTASPTLYQEIIQMPVDLSIVDLKDYKSKFNNQDNFYNLYAFNPYFVLNENGNRFEENRVFGNAQVDYEFVEWLKATVRVGGDIANSSLLDWTAIAHTDPTGHNADRKQVDGSVSEGTRFAREVYGDFIVSASKELTESFSLQALAGYSVQERYFKNFNAAVATLSIPNFYNLANSDEDPIAGTTESKTRLVGLYGQATLGYKDYLFLTVQARNDWSSTLPTQNNSFFYPSANLSFSFVDAFKLSGPVSSGKIRAAIGRTGKDAAVYNVYTTLANGGITIPFGSIDFPFGGVNAFEISNTLGNEELKPELSTEVEVGANVQFLDNRVGFDLALYDKRTVNQIYAVPFAFSSGYGFKTLNFGEIQNKGIELLITAVPVKTNNFTWNTSVNFTKNMNKVLSLTDGLEQVTLGGVYGFSYVAEPGQPLGTFYVPDVVRDDNGNLVVSASTGIPLNSATDVRHGNAQAKWIMGFNNQFTYKGITLSAGIDIRYGGLIYSYSKRLTTFVGNATQTLYNDRQPFIVPNSVIQPIDAGTGEPQVDDDGNPVYVENTTPISISNISGYWNPNNNHANFDFFLDRSYMKLRELALSYRLPKAVLSKTPFKSIDVTLVGRNLLLWTPKENNFIDPEMTTWGNDIESDLGEFAGGPTTRSYGFSLKASF